MSKQWKKGRGKFGFLQPLLGNWHAEAESQMGPVRCTRSFEPILNGSYIQLVARWEFGPDAKPPEQCDPASVPAVKVYEERAIIGAGEEGKIGFWSFTSDGKRSQGVVTDVTDLHPEAIGFEAKMPAGSARMAYWPDEDGDGFYWVVESKTQKGWNRFTKHHYHPVQERN